MGFHCKLQYMVVLKYSTARRVRAFFGGVRYDNIFFGGGSDTMIAVCIGQSAVIHTKTIALFTTLVTGRVRTVALVNNEPANY
jgi:hypothetical protein